MRMRFEGRATCASAEPIHLPFVPAGLCWLSQPCPPLPCALSMKLPWLIPGALLVLLLPGRAAASASALDLRTFVGCAVREFTFLARKRGCRGLRVTTDACWGRCETWEKPILEPPYIESHHRICTYNETRMVTVKLPRCAPGVDPFYTYPVAIRCDCDICSTATTECETY
uniref:Glycoprotein hormone beta-5 n=2 Tax=Geospiza parvula TaxID=87175 RepID=A0A8C3QAN0_GEOPR